jgi:hypothetical protein
LSINIFTEVSIRYQIQKKSDALIKTKNLHKMDENLHPENYLIQCPDCERRANRSTTDKIIEKLNVLKNTAILGFIIGIFYSYSWAMSGKNCIERYEQINCIDEEHAIIIANHKGWGKNLVVWGSGIDLLVKYFNSNSIKFKIHYCHNPECFRTAIVKSKAPNLWIFAHGDRHGVSFAKDCYFPFCKIKGSNRRSFIGQIHCCHNSGTTLWEYLSDKPGLFSEGIHDVYQFRKDIEKWINDNKK